MSMRLTMPRCPKCDRRSTLGLRPEKNGVRYRCQVATCRHEFVVATPAAK